MQGEKNERTRYHYTGNPEPEPIENGPWIRALDFYSNQFPHSWVPRQNPEPGSCACFLFVQTFPSYADQLQITPKLEIWKSTHYSLSAPWLVERPQERVASLRTQLDQKYSHGSEKDVGLGARKYFLEDRKRINACVEHLGSSLFEFSLPCNHCTVLHHSSNGFEARTRHHRARSLLLRRCHQARNLS